MPFMVFTEDKYVNDELFAPKNTQVNVESESVERWIKRGGRLVDDDGEVIFEAAPVVEPVTPVDAKDGPPNVLEPLTLEPEIIAPSSPVVRRGPGRPKKI